jgi:ketosteroid isomerase-like protein
MSHENVEAVRAVYAGWREGDFRAGTERYDEFVLMTQGEGFPERGAYIGLDGIGGYMHTFLEAWDHVTIDAEELLDAGESVVAAVVQHATGRDSGAAVEFRYFQVWTFRNGRVIRLDVIRERAAALEAAGIGVDATRPE